VHLQQSAQGLGLFELLHLREDNIEVQMFLEKEQYRSEPLKPRSEQEAIYDSAFLGTASGTIANRIHVVPR